jgi:YafQ family addiction module toxin component
LYALQVEDEVDKAFKRLLKKDRMQLEAVNKKIKQILADPYQFKPLRFPLEGLRRVHVGHFVLIYKVVEEPATVILVKYSHHDVAYR